MRWRVMAGVMIGVLLGGAACERGAQEAETSASAPAASASEASSEEQALTERAPEAPAPEGGESLSEGWRPVPELSVAQKAQLERADRARGALTGRLLGEVTSTAKAEGFAQAVQVCEKRAGPLTEAVGDEHDVRIGRTSFKLRNPDNDAPAWARPWVQARVEQPQHAVHEDGRLGVLAPIRVMKPCLNCHGPADQLAPGVSEALAEHYPKDQATGFAEGDLRGWFWIEVPADPS